MKKNIKQPCKPGYTGLFDQILAIVQNARQHAVKIVDRTQVWAYWHIGMAIVEHEQRGRLRADYGQQTLMRLSADLTSHCGKGFSVDNLQNMRRFYQGFPAMFKNYGTLSRNFMTQQSAGKTV